MPGTRRTTESKSKPARRVAARKTAPRVMDHDTKEFLKGAALALGLMVEHCGAEPDEAKEVLSQMGYDFDDLIEAEVEPGDIKRMKGEDPFED